MKKIIFLALFMIAMVIFLLSAKSDQMASKAYTNEYVAFSLKNAEARIISAAGRVDPDLMNLGGITRIEGLVVDREREDIIIVGEKNSGTDGALLTLDDFAVILRARIILNQWPLVSI